MAAAALQVLFYVTPVIWRREMLRSHGLDWVVRINPLYHLLEVVRRPLLESQPAPAASYLVTLLLVAVLTGSAWLTARVYHRRIVYFL
jgi:ABC-type polysaccharide/polyol phosphate export permease